MRLWPRWAPGVNRDFPISTLVRPLQQHPHPFATIDHDHDCFHPKYAIVLLRIVIVKNINAVEKIYTLLYSIPVELLA
jgi:hypothetical protein